MIHKLACLLFVTLLATHLSAAEPSADEQAVRAAVETYVKAFNQGDAQAVANHWADDAEYQLPSGDRVQGRKAIRGVFEKMFGGPNPPKIDVVKARIRFVSKDVAVEEGTVRVTSKEEAPEDSTYIAVHVRKGKEWKLNTVHETASQAPTEAAAAEHPLKDLEWLVGAWSEDSTSGTQTRFSWSKNRTFLTCQFNVKLPGGEVLEGTQVIGWDPESKVIRSWLFDEDGGFGEGLWTRTESGWSIKFVQVLPDGRRASATNVYDRVNDDTFSWKSTNRLVDGTAANDVPPIHAVRVHSSADKEPRESK